MIPHIIHYCWLSGEEYPALVRQCLDSWKKKLPDWEFRLWDASCLEEINSPYAWGAYRDHTYALACDVIRLYAVQKYGGFYLDLDVEVLKDLEPLTSLPYVFGMEHGTGGIEAAVFGSEPGNDYLQRCFDFFKDKSYLDSAGKRRIYPLPKVMSDAMGNRQMIESINDFDRQAETTQVFPFDFFSPKNFMDSEKKGWLSCTENTFTFHHFRVSWLPPTKKASILIRRLLGKNRSNFLFSIWNKLRLGNHD